MKTSQQKRRPKTQDDPSAASSTKYDRVVLKEINDEAVAAGRGRIEKNLLSRVKKGRLPQERFDEGKTDRISVRLSKSNLEATKATIPSLEIGLRQANNRLCVLLGIPP